MTICRILCAIFLTYLGAASTYAQDGPSAPNPAADPVLTRRPPASPGTAPSHDNTSTNEAIPLTVSKGTPVQVAVDQDVRVRIGQPIKGHVVEPVYVFDKLVIPVGTIVTGQIKTIEDISARKRTMAALDAEFTPAHQIEVEFSELVLPDGKHIPVQTAVTPGSGQVVNFVTAADEQHKNGVKDVASEKARESRDQAKREWDAAMQQVRQPGKIHRVKRYAISQLPIHPQYIDAGTIYFAELQDALNFGSEPLTPQLASSLTLPPPDSAFVHARLVTALSSATTKKGAAVEAIVSRPLFDGDRLSIPQGAALNGSVVQVERPRYFSHNGQLRFVFHDLVLPDGLDHKVDAILQGVQGGKTDDLRVDSEGGSQASTPKTRYLSTAISIGLAMGGHEDDPINRAEGGAGGFKLLGIALGLAVRSQPFVLAMGAFGASRSVYAHFIARGHDVSFPKNTAMVIGIGTHRPASNTARPKT